MSPDLRRHETLVPTEIETKQALVALGRLQPYLDTDDVELPAGVVIPQAALRLFADVLAEMANGNAVRVVPVEAELTTQQAADLLNVSRPYLIDLLDTGRLAYRRVGNRRRILAEDILAYKRIDDEHRAKILDELSREGQLLNLD